MRNKERGTSREMIIHPGETLKEVMEDRNISIEDLTQSTGFPQSYITSILNCKEKISYEFAKELENALKIDADFWLKLYELYNKELKTFEKSNLIPNGQY